jgi:spermidine/putrescine transport system permease protein
MTAAPTPSAQAGGGTPLRARLRRALPFILLAPGILWLVVFYVLPAAWMFVISISSGSVQEGFRLTGSLEAYEEAVTRFPRQFGNSLLYAGTATVLTFLIGFPVAYTIAFRGGRLKNLLLFMVIAPFFTSFLIRTISWQVLLGDEGPILAFLKHDLGVLSPDFRVLGSATAVIAGLTYNFLPFMILPLYVALEKIDPRLIEASHDLYADRFSALRRVTIPLALPGIFAGTLLTFIPAMGDFINAELLGTPRTQMVGNVIQGRFLALGDYQVAAALSFLLMAGILVAVIVYARALGTEQLTG